jgi:NADH dehydrogenase FAD-containing subunit
MNITIVGGGFGGAKTALELAKDSANHIQLITDKPDFQYYPALYGAATGRSHLESWVPLEEIFRGKKNITVTLDTITSIDSNAKTLQGQSGVSHPYETCVLALGTVTTYFGIEGLDSHAFGIKSASEIANLTRQIRTDVIENGKLDSRYVVIGAGPTGVELAAALGSYLRRLCKKHGVKSSTVTIDLIEAAPRVLPRMSEKSSAVVTRRLRKLGVNVQTDKKVESATADAVMVSGESLASHTVIWTSGVANHPFYKANEAQFEFAPNGRVVVDEYMQTQSGVYVIGDNAATQFTGLAQTALHDALFVAGNLKRAKKNQPLEKYEAIMPPVVVPVGEYWAVFEWHKLRMSGWIGSVIRKAADFMGYSDILPIGQALGVWRAGREKNE